MGYSIRAEDRGLAKNKQLKDLHRDRVQELVRHVPVLRTASKGTVLGAKAVKTQAKGRVVAANAVEAPDKGSDVAVKAVEAPGKGTVAAVKPRVKALSQVQKQ